MPAGVSGNGALGRRGGSSREDQLSTVDDALSSELRDACYGDRAAGSRGERLPREDGDLPMWRQARVFEDRGTQVKASSGLLR